MSKLKDITGQRFGRLVVISQAPRSKTGVIRWHARCDCGTDRIVYAGSLIRGTTKSCGCLQREIAVKVATTHGMRHTVEYKAWLHINYRCHNPRCKKFPLYGGRGIKVTKRWRASFENFFRDMGKRPENKSSIDRIDNNGDYEPNNCRWSDPKEQANNTRSVRRMTFRGITRTLNQWSRITRIPVNIIHSRRGLGWTPERILTQPVRRSSRRKKHP